VRSGTRVTIELEGRYVRGRGSVDDYLEQTAIANPHVTIHYIDPENHETTYARSTGQLPPEPREIKPHPYGIELGRLVTMLKDTTGGTMAQFLTDSFSRVRPGVAKQICDAAKISTRANPKFRTRRSARPPPTAFHRLENRLSSRGCTSRCRASSFVRPHGRRPSIVETRFSLKSASLMAAPVPLRKSVSKPLPICCRRAMRDPFDNSFSRPLTASERQVPKES
jgi:DNA topoisomerase VI subunit B